MVDYSLLLRSRSDMRPSIEECLTPDAAQVVEVLPEEPADILPHHAVDFGHLQRCRPLGFQGCVLLQRPGRERLKVGGNLGSKV